ncbi:Fic family protein [Streptomyces sp. DH37]|uniref:type II toxin-antitoxin system death-on-curing family toxin n=1 Tax=Streptomyces sp. DH37 TaxID=3040122 RepID=UPI0030155645
MSEVPVGPVRTGPGRARLRGQEIAVRDPGLLDTALLRPRPRMFGIEAYPGLLEKAAALPRPPVPNCPLVDGSKRLARMCTAVFPDLNGVDMTDVDQDRAYGIVVGIVVDIAAGKPEDVSLIAGSLRALRGDL